MLAILIFLSVWTGVSCHLTPYKKISLDASQWPKYINKSTTFRISGNIECGALCSSQPFGACDLFTMTKSKKQCHIGYFSNTQTDYFTETVSGSQVVFINTGNLGNDFENSFEALTMIDTENVWSGYIYRYVEMDKYNDLYDCSALCKNIDKEQGCDLFFFGGQTCYLGSSSHSGGSIDTSYSNATVYVTPGAFSSLIALLGQKDNVGPNHWLPRILETRTDITSIEVCATLALFENWHFAVFDADTCSLGEVKVGQGKEEIEGLSTTVYLNLPQLADFQTESSVIRTSTEVYYSNYVYNSLSDVKSLENCNIHCAFDPDYNCDFYIFQNGFCYLGNFLETSPISGPTGTLDVYIYKEHLRNSSSNVFPYQIQSPKAYWSKYIQWNFDVSSELECAAHASLVDRGDFYTFVDPKCKIGNFQYSKSAVPNQDETLIHIHTRNGEIYKTTFYNEQLLLPASVWTKWISAVIELSADETMFHCMIHCKLRAENCDFFGMESNKCYIGLYSRPNNQIISSESELIFSFNTGQFMNYRPNDFWWYKDQSYNWGRFIYKVQSYSPAHGFSCYWIALEDPQCHIFITEYNNCYFGNMDHVGTVDISLDTWIHIPNGHPNEDFIDQYFVDRNGETDTSIGLISATYWAHAIYHAAPNPDEASCAIKCITSKSTRCNFYIVANGYCQLGQFNSMLNYGIGPFSDSTTFKLRTDLEIPVLMEELAGTSSANCMNTGYNQITFGESLTIASDGFNFFFPSSYGTNEYCYWTIYSPGSKSLKVKVVQFMVGDTVDILQIKAGTGQSSYVVQELTGNHTNFEVDIVSRFIALRWYSNGDTVSNGWVAVIESN